MPPPAPAADMYSLSDYGNMIADAWRFGAYAKALAKAVRTGDAVAEIGCGPGVFSLLACRAGARRVYAIESEDSIEFARALAAANGFAERIEFIQSDSRKAELPERVNVIVSDIRGTLPLSGSAVAAIEDARQRFLTPGGVLIPQKDTLYAAVDLAAAARLALPPEHEERGVYVAEGRVMIGDTAVGEGELALLRTRAQAEIEAPLAARLMLLGGEKVDGPRFIWWNFVSSSKARIEGAKDDWRDDKFPPIPGETERIPLPER